MRKIVTNIHVRAISLRSTAGVLSIGGVSVPCRFGHGGRGHLKREGDGATPIGIWQMRKLYWRADRGFAPRTRLSCAVLKRDMGWCDDVRDRNYNRPVRLPYAASHEAMARHDHLYDIVVILSHNERPRVRGLGSAVFFHLTGPAVQPTAGCIAVSETNMRKLLAVCGRQTRIVVWSSSGPPAGGGRRSPSPRGHGSRHN